MQTDLSALSVPCFLTYPCSEGRNGTPKLAQCLRNCRPEYLLWREGKSGIWRRHPYSTFRSRWKRCLWVVPLRQSLFLCCSWLTEIITEAGSGGWGGRKQKKRSDPHSRSPWWTCHLAYTLRSCRFKLAEGIQAEDFPLTGEESFARLSLSLGVKAVTDPNAYTVVAAFQFLITAWLVRINEGSHVRMINIPIMRTSQAEDDFLCKIYSSKSSAACGNISFLLA